MMFASMRDQLESSEEMTLVGLQLLIQNMKEPHPLSDDNCKIEDLHDPHQLDAEVSAITRAVEIIQEIANKRIARCYRRRNQVASLILQAPEEIISTTFIHIFQSTPSTHKYRSLRDIRLVCSDFHRISESTPRLWSYIGNTESPWESPSLNISLLEKSRGAPLDIDLCVLREKNSLELLDAVFKHSPRWRTFKCRYDSFSHEELNEFYTSMEQFANVQAPQLRELTIEAPCWSIPSKQCILLRNDAPSIVHLDIISIPVSWDSPLLSGLSFLRIIPWQGTRSPTSEQYIQVLTSCPQLEELYLTRGEYSSWEGEGSPTSFHTEIQLQKLKVLDIQYLHPVTVRSLLSSIKANPRDLTIMFTNDAAGREEEVLEMAFSAPSCRSFLSKFIMSAKRLWIQTISSGICDIRAETKSTEGAPLTFRCSINSMRSLAHIYRDLFPPSVRRTIHTLELSVCDEQFFEGGLTPYQLFDGLVGLEELRLPSSHTDPWRLLTPLSKPVTISTANLSEMWLCPRLRKLEFEGIDFSIDDLWKFLECRYTSTGSPSRELQINVVKNRYYIGNEDDETALSTLSEVARLIGRENLSFNGHQLNSYDEWEKISQIQ
ncbi:hypothetical protein FRC03_000760 [Tulasnella sp. 419]|nr:hypothetical protein FRC03_000760 [Tulasnella sp. 419]